MSVSHERIVQALYNARQNAVELQNMALNSAEPSDGLIELYEVEKREFSEIIHALN